MKSIIGLSILLLLPVSITYADTPVAKDSEQVCEKRITAFKSSLEAVITDNTNKANSAESKQDVEAAKAELTRINQLPTTLTACEKQRQIPATYSMSPWIQSTVCNKNFTILACSRINVTALYHWPPALSFVQDY
jgi:hypothetical protein